MRRSFVLLAASFAASGALGPQEQGVLDRISAADMRGNLSFLSSDLLEGRETPSRGLDIAAEFIASQFRRAGLVPAGTNEYFQVADYVQVTPDAEGLEVTLDAGGKTIHAKDSALQSLFAVDLTAAPVYKVESGKPPSLEGKVAVLEVPDTREQGGRENYDTFQRYLKAAREKHPAAIVVFGHRMGARPSGPRLVEATADSAPMITIRDNEVLKVLSGLNGGNSKTTITVHAREPKKEPARLRNVAGVLQGSDAELAKTYVLVTAHYDHIGVKTSGDGDRIYNGANDDGSGTVSVIEIANAMAAMKPHPKRSILFLTFFGEEKGLYGSRYYAEHPLFPLKQTVAQINLEQLGRTDDTEGAQVASATFTGFDFSDVPEFFRTAGKATGVKVYKNEKNSDAFFARSDNQSLADAGVPAHTLAVAFEFPDYHKVGDEWPKIDYENMAKVDRMVALGLLAIADRPEPPHWNEKNGKTEKYVEAARTLNR